MIKVGIIGAGMVTEKVHLPEYDEREDVEVIALADVDVQRAKRLAEKYAVKEIYEDWTEVAKNKEINGVSICTPVHLHKDMVCMAAENRKHILCEKPMALTLDEADSMIRAAERSGVILMMALNQRFISAHQVAKGVLDSGMLGKINTIRTIFGHSGPELWSPTFKWFFDGQKSGGGALIDIGIHKFDIMHWFTGKEATEVAAFTETRERNIEVEDNACCMVRFKGGTLGVVEASWTVKPYVDNSLVAYCEKGTLRIGMERDKSRTMVVYITSPQEGEIVYDVPPFAMPGEFNSGVIDHFIECVKHGSTPIATGYDGREALKFALAAYESAKTGKVVKLK